MMHSTLFLLRSYFQVTVTILLAITPFISATPSPTRTYPPPKHLDFRAHHALSRDGTGEPPPPPGSNFVGCFTDDPAKRALTSLGFSDPTNMTIEECVRICQSPSPHIYAGLENGTDCYCGNVLTPGSVKTSLSNCNSSCVANPNEICGGNNFLSLYSNGTAPGPQPTFTQFIPSAISWDFGGCLSDNNDNRTLTTEVTVDGGQFALTPERCVDKCVENGFRGAGLELAQQCWCGNSTNGGKSIDPSNCMMACPGDSTQNCGGPNALAFYFLDGN